ncbi:Peroxin-3 [Irpex rosettiformis]|uniref:Peroxin-3 n=1 Tax=Irpex rosettiformis TaxID=378272 RepID=A0ACB8U5G9_9APHY|nr:Peroxin-3 [Irpex rosettiformis]
MLDAVKQYVVDRQGGLKRAAAYIGSGYLFSTYVARSLRETRDAVVHDRIAKENLRRRFEQNQQDISFTIMALLPTIGARIIEGMNVEEITEQLQSQSRAAKAKEELQPPPAPPSNENASSSAGVEVQVEDGKSDSGSVSVVSAASQASTSDLNASMTNSSMSWVDQLSQSTSSAHSPQPPQEHPLKASDPEPRQKSDSPNSNIGTDLSDSMITSSSVSYGDIAHQAHSPPTTSYTPSKAELWREIKMLTFTRTLTVLYSLTLLSLFTHVQLNILGRHKYIQSVIQLARDELEREHMAESLSISSLFFRGGLEKPSESDLLPLEPIKEETERKYLTLSWWILYVGWKDVGERVRRAVEEVFEGVALKTKLSASDLHRLLNDVRRRVEFEVTFEGVERRTKFTSTLLPPTPETLQHVLTQGGIPSFMAAQDDPEFLSLLSETQKYLLSGSFERVLEVCLDRATDILSSGLEKNVFGSVVEDPNSLPALGQEPRVRLAGMLPGLARWCHLALEGLPNELVDGLADVREVHALSAIIYSDYDDLLR